MKTLRLIAALLLSSSPLALAQEEPPLEEFAADEIIVTATRTPETIATVPGSVTVITREELEALSSVSQSSLGDALGKLVPGLALGSHSNTTFGQTLRGRNVLVMIDGVPQSAVRNVQHDLQAVDFSAVERVEVIRGTTAIYGEGASGGIINVITRKTGTSTPKFETKLEASTAPTAVVRGLGGALTQSGSGQTGALGWTVSGSLQRSGGSFDAEGDLIPPDPHGQGGLADSTSYSLFGKFRYRINDTQRLQLSATHFDGTQVTSFASDPSVKSTTPLSEKARAIEGLQLDDPQTNRNSMVSLQWDHDEVLGSTVRMQGYFRDHLTRFFPFDGRAHQANYGNNIIQSRLETQKGGGRLEVGTPLPFNLSALWGADVSRETTAQPVSLLDHAAYDTSGGMRFDVIGNRDWVPTMNTTAMGAFTQLEWAAFPWMTVRAGTRYEQTFLQVPDYTTLADVRVGGGQLEFGRPLFNAGVVVSPVKPLSLYANYAQGFSLPDAGLILRNAKPGPDGGPVTVESLETGPQAVDLIEVGARGTWQAVQSSLVFFYNRSDLGTSSGGLNQPVVRAPERVYGLEATLAMQPVESLALESTFTWLEGQLDKKDDGNYTFLNSYRIPPPKLTFSARHETLPGWHNEILFVYSGPRRRFGSSTAFGERPVDPYFTVDLMSSLPVGPGRLKAGVSNLLNHQYYARESQLLRSGTNESYAAAPGRVVSLGYAVTY